MLKCKKCQGTHIRTRTNYSHGKKSGSTTSVACKDCGCTEMELPQKQRGRHRNK